MTEIRDRQCGQDEANGPDLVFAFLAGHLKTEESRRVAAHLRECEGPCVEKLTAASFVVQAVLSERGVKPPPPRGGDSRKWARLLDRIEEEATKLVRSPPFSWEARLDAHPLRDNADFLQTVAIKAGGWEAKDSATALALSRNILARAAGIESRAGSRAMAASCLLHGFATTCQGNHVGALKDFRSARRALGDAVLDPMAPYLDLAEADACRRMGRFHDALRLATRALEQLASWGSADLPKASWQLANIACQMGESRTAFHAAVRAYRAFRADGKEKLAEPLLLTVVAVLIDLRRIGPATRLAASLAESAAIMENGIHAGRLAWLQARLARIGGDLEAATEAIERAEQMFEGSGALAASVGVLIERAMIEEVRGDDAAEAAAASSALALAGRIPGLTDDAAESLSRLGEALSRRTALSAALTSAIRHFRVC